MTFENGTFYRIELPQMCPQSEISNYGSLKKVTSYDE